MSIKLFYSGKVADVGAAKAVCTGCPFRDECLDWALEYEEYGTWGGKSEDERRVMNGLVSKRRPRPYRSRVAS